MPPAVITSVINFCSNDYRLLKACIEGVRPFSKAILIPVCDHFFDGSQENYSLLEHAYSSFPDCVFIEYSFDPKESYRRFTPHYPEHINWRHEWANTSRWISYFFLPEDTEFIFFLDVDEIVDGTRFTQWLAENDITPYAALSFSAYWYFRQASYQATRYDDISLMVKKDALVPDHLWHSDERAGILINASGKKRYRITGNDGNPLVHHYSWVRTEEELHKKFNTWSHHWERPWTSLLEAEFAGPFLGKDFIRGYTYRTVPAYFDPLSEKMPELPFVSLERHLEGVRHFKNVIRVEKKEMQKKEIMHSLQTNFSCV